MRYLDRRGFAAMDFLRDIEGGLIMKGKLRHRLRQPIGMLKLYEQTSLRANVPSTGSTGYDRRLGGTAMSVTQWIDESENEGVVRREFTIEAERPVTGVLWQPARPIGGKPLVLFGHGASGTRHQAPIPWMSQRFVTQFGFSTLAIDGPVHGRRSRGDGGREAFSEEWRRSECVDDMIADWSLAIDAAATETGGDRLAYWGLSMGTIFGVPLVAARQDIEVAVLGLMGTVGPTERYKEEIRQAAANIHCPLLFLMQLDDELFARDRCLDLFDRFTSADKRLHANPGGHPEVPMEELEQSIAFIGARLVGSVD